MTRLKARIPLVAIFIIASLGFSSANAGLIEWYALLDPSQEAPPVTGSDGAGIAFGFVDTDSGDLGWLMFWENLSGPALAAHFHGPASPGTNAGVQVNIGVPDNGFFYPGGVALGGSNISTPQITDLLSGLWYINIHTQANLGGEIRGQVIAKVAEPGTLVLLGGGLLGLVLMRRKRAA